MENLIDILKSLNRKERYWLIKNTTGDSIDELDAAFITKLNKNLDNKFPKIPSNASVFFDYQLDWIIAAISIYSDNLAQTAEIPIPKDIDFNLLDIDMLIVWEDNKYYMIFAEAKFDTGWKNKQLDDKIKKIKQIEKIFTQKGIPSRCILLILSRKKPEHISDENLKYIKAWLPLDHSQLKKFTRSKDRKRNKEGLSIIFSIIEGTKKETQ